VEFADEFASGVPYASAYAIQSTLGVGGAALNAWTFFVPQIVALIIEPYLILRSERWGKRLTLAVGLWGMGISLLLGALAPTPEVLGLSVALYFPSSGLACGVAQLLLLDGPDGNAESLTDWTLAGTLGDLGTPLLFWALDAAGFSWRATFALVGTALVLFGIVGPTRGAGLPAASLEAEDETTEPEVDEPSLIEAFRLVLGNRPLLWWLLATALCSLLDELFASQIGIHVAHGQDPRATTDLVTLHLVAMGIGGAVGLLVQRRLLASRSGKTLLWMSSAATLLVFGVWLAALPSTLSVLAAPLLGALIATHYPLTQAEAYDLMPGQAHIVAAASQAFSGIDLLYPVLVGVLSDALHPAVGLCALLLQPLGILTALTVTRKSAERRDL
jgi:MFS family permease